MSQPFKEFLAKLTKAQKVLGDYWRRSPTNKLILINTGVYVRISSSSACGSSESSLKISWSNISHANDSMLNQADCTPSSAMPFPIWVSLVYVHH